MRNLTPDTITKAFAEYAKNAPSARTRELLVSLAGHLHGFVRENKLTQAEWGAAIDALTKAMKFTDDKRNEYILFSDLLGVSSLVDMVNAAKSGTPSSVLGPFHIEGAPELSDPSRGIGDGEIAVLAFTLAHDLQQDGPFELHQDPVIPARSAPGAPGAVARSSQSSISPRTSRAPSSRRRSSGGGSPSTQSWGAEAQRRRPRPASAASRNRGRSRRPRWTVDST